jgi:ankyrin repeat protein
MNSKHTDGNSMLHLASKGGNAVLVKILLDKGAKVNAVNASDQTALFVAVYNTAPKPVIELLINGGSDVNSSDKVRLLFYFGEDDQQH